MATLLFAILISAILLFTYKFWKKSVSFVNFDNHKFKKFTTQQPVLLIGFVFILYLIKNLFLIAKITNLNWLVLVLSVILQVVLFFIFDKNSSLKSKFISLTVCYSIIVFSLIINGLIYDYSWDGQAYHQPAVIFLNNGWNPFYEYAPDKWISAAVAPSIINFPKFTWIFGSVFSSVFGNIEVGKAYNLLFAIITFLYSLNFVSRYQNKPVIVLLISLFLTANPVLLAQIFTYYNDGFLGMLVLLTIFSLMDYERTNKIIYLFATLAICVFAINIKFTGFIVGIIIGAYILKNLFAKQYLKSLKITVLGVAVLLVGVGFTGYNPYITNTIENKNPFYPIYGENAQYIQNQHPNTPDYLKDKGYCYRFMNLFCKSDSKRHFIPFSPYRIAEIDKCKVTDTKIGGFGVFFIEICILSILLALFTLYSSNWRKYKDILFAVFILFFLTAILPENWWARFVSWSWYIPVLLLVIANFDKRKILTITTFLIFAMNNLIFFYGNITSGIEYTTKINNLKNTIRLSEKENFEIGLSADYFEYSIKEKFKNIDKKIIYSTDFQNDNRIKYTISGW